MLYQILGGMLSDGQILSVGLLVSFLLTYFLLNAKFSFLPHDQGRAFAVNGALSKGKLRGVGLLVAIAFLIAGLLTLPLSLELVGYMVLIFLIMLSGYLDDASSTPWQDYKKGAIDLVISIATMALFLTNNPTTVHFFGAAFDLPAPLYALLGIILIWTAINVTNCSDGVDGLCATLTIVTVGSFIWLFGADLGEYGDLAALLLASIAAYLYFNCSPSSQLMGDAGSRTFGYFIALLAMKSGHPFAYLLLSLVMIIDGGIGLVKVFLKRFFKIWILKNTKTPIHDHLRKSKGWSDTQVVFRLAIIQVLVSIVAGILITH